MTNFRAYGETPYRAALIHGGPGAPGEMAPVARELSVTHGILEPFQTARSITAQVAELKSTLETHGDLPMTLIGFSWGAWLAALYTAEHPQDVLKLVLIGSGSFEEKYTADMHSTRLGRLSADERVELTDLTQVMSTLDKNTDQAFTRAGELFSKADAYDPLPSESEILSFQADVYRSVWPLAAEMRRSGNLLAAVSSIQCPVVALHGDHDPHPAEGVRVPLEKVLPDFRFILLERCGHKPWIERHARQRFFQILRDELNTLANKQ
jgi:pimeloyl-ACP methyl ester carboxylesterase